MSSIKNLKKDINYVLGDIIEVCYAWEVVNPKADKKQIDAVIDEAIASFDTLIEKVNAKKVENKKAHFKQVHADLEAVAKGLLEKINNL